jgi:hypothetical protein
MLATVSDEGKKFLKIGPNVLFVSVASLSRFSIFSGNLFYLFSTAGAGAGAGARAGAGAGAGAGTHGAGAGAGAGAGRSRQEQDWVQEHIDSWLERLGKDEEGGRARKGLGL